MPSDTPHIPPAFSISSPRPAIPPHRPQRPPTQLFYSLPPLPEFGGLEEIAFDKMNFYFSNYDNPTNLPISSFNLETSRCPSPTLPATPSPTRITTPSSTPRPASPSFGYRDEQRTPRRESPVKAPPSSPRFRPVQPLNDAQFKDVCAYAPISLAVSPTKPKSYGQATSKALPPPRDAVPGLSWSFTSASSSSSDDDEDTVTENGDDCFVQTTATQAPWTGYHASTTTLATALGNTFYVNNNSNNNPWKSQTNLQQPPKQRTIRPMKSMTHIHPAFRPTPTRSTTSFDAQRRPAPQASKSYSNVQDAYSIPPVPAVPFKHQASSKFHSHVQLMRHSDPSVFPLYPPPTRTAPTPDERPMTAPSQSPAKERSFEGSWWDYSDDEDEEEQTVWKKWHFRSFSSGSAKSKSSTGGTIGKKGFKGLFGRREASN